MKTLRTLLLIIGVTLLCSLAIATPKKKYGKSLSLKKVTPISTILETPDKFKGKKLLVEGTIVDVCAKRGCWIMIAGDKEFEKLRFKVEDGVITFPMDAKGKKARAEGILSVETASKEDLIAEGKKHAEETGEKFDPATVTGPETYIQLNGIGAEVR